MGNKHSVFTKEELEGYVDCTFFTDNEILQIFELFSQLVLTGQSDIAPQLSIADLTKEDPKNNIEPAVKDKSWADSLFLTRKEFLSLPIIAHNPFAERIHKVFCSDEEKGNINFEDFLDFLSVFSPEASKDVKSYTAFKIYGTYEIWEFIGDFNDDGFIDRDDFMTLIKKIVGKELEENEVEVIFDKIMEEVDFDGDRQLSFVEFDQIVARSPDFLNLFRIRVL